MFPDKGDFLLNGACPALFLGWGSRCTVEEHACFTLRSWPDHFISSHTFIRGNGFFFQNRATKITTQISPYQLCYMKFDHTVKPNCVVISVCSQAGRTLGRPALFKDVQSAVLSPNNTFVLYEVCALHSPVRVLLVSSTPE